MPQFARLFRAEDGAEPDEGDGAMSFVASLPGTKRDGADLAGLPWRVDNFRANPVVTWVHDFAGARLPIGRAEVEVAAGQRAEGEGPSETMRARIVFDEADDFAAEVARKYRDGFLHAISVSWEDVDAEGVPTRASGEDAVAHDLLEIAAVPVPGDPGALLERQAAAARALLASLDEPSGLRKLDAESLAEYDGYEDDDDPRPAMVAALDPDADLDDDERAGAWEIARQAYQRAGLVWPDLEDGATLRAMSGDEWRSLFLEGELEAVGVRAGAVLSRQNEADLQEAARLIRKVIRNAGSDLADGDDEADETERAAYRSLLDEWRTDDDNSPAEAPDLWETLTNV